MAQILNKIYSFLSDGDEESPSGLMNVDGSVTPQEFYIEPPGSEKWLIRRAIIEIQDGGNWNSTTFGSLSGLTNGVGIAVYGGTDLKLNMVPLHNIKQNADWAGFSYDTQFPDFPGSSDTVMTTRWSLFKDDNEDDGLILSGHRSERLTFTVNDDLTDLTDFHVYIRGRKLV